MASNQPGLHDFQHIRSLTFYLCMVSIVICGCSSVAGDVLSSATPSHQTNLPAADLTAAPGLTPIGSNQPGEAGFVASPTSTPERLKPTAVLTVTPTLRQTAPSPTASTTPTSEKIPEGFAPIQIRSPGENSNVLSPLPLEVDIRLPDASRLIQIDLVDEDGLLLFRQVLGLSETGEEFINITRDIDFEIRSSPIIAYLIVRLESHPNRPLAVNSALLTLQSEGEASVLSFPLQKPFIDIQEPRPEAEIFSGELVVMGTTQADDNRPLRVQLIGDDGKIIAQRLAKVTSQELPGLNSFESLLPFSVRQRTPARIVVFQNDGPNSEVTHLASVPVILSP